MGCKSLDFLSFPVIDQCCSEGREKQIIAADLDGILVKGRSSFPYFMLVAFETRGLIRAVLLLILSPIAWLLYNFVSESAGIKLLIYVSLAGVKACEIEAVGRAVLPKFYLDDLHHGVWRIFSAFGQRILVTPNPRIMVESFAKEYLGVDRVIGTEIEVDCKGRATGFVLNPGVLVGEKKEAALRQAMGDGIVDVGLGERKSDEQFMNLCMEAYRVSGHNYAKSKEMEIGEGIFAQKFAKPVVFHDGRLVQRPTPAISLITLLWFPFGFIIAIIRIAAGSLLPMNLVFYAFWILGVRVIVKGNPPSPSKKKSGVLFVCSHRSLLDPIFLSAALGRPVTAVTYSISRLSELLSPIKTVRLTRNRSQDAENIKNLLEQGDLAICPEGTTCREPFLLRFSSLFAELSDQIVPVAMNNKMSMFHGTSARGWKGMDPFFYFMNPSPVYEVTFLDQVPVELTCSGGRNSHEVANYIQRVLAGCLSFECTSFTRKDKYRVLAGHDGVFPSLNKR